MEESVASLHRIWSVSAKLALALALELALVLLLLLVVVLVLVLLVVLVVVDDAVFDVDVDVDVDVDDDVDDAVVDSTVTVLLDVSLSNPVSKFEIPPSTELDPEPEPYVGNSGSSVVTPSMQRLHVFGQSLRTGSPIIKSVQ